MASLDISVIIPTYNREKYIKKAVESVLAQRGQGRDFSIIEVLIVDDGSTDNTEEIVKSIDSRLIVYHRFEKNKGAIEAWNTGIEMAKGEWIAFQDSDDRWHEDKLEKQTAYLSAHRDVSMVAHPFRAFFTDGSETVTRVVDSENMIKELAVSNFIGTPTMLIKREALIEMGGFNRNIRALQDWDYVVKFADRYKIGMVPDVLLDVDMTVEGMSKDASNYYESRCKIIAGNKDIFIKNGCFDDAVRSLLMHADSNGVLGSVGKMLELYLKSE